MQTRLFRGVGEPLLGHRTLKCVLTIGTRSAQSIRASGTSAASTGRTRDRTRPMLQRRQKVLAKAPSTRDPKRLSHVLLCQNITALLVDLVQRVYEVTAQDASGHCSFLIRSRTLRKDLARPARRTPRRSTRRSKARLPPRQTALGEPVHIVHIQNRSHVLLSWVVSTHEERILFYRNARRDDICF